MAMRKIQRDDEHEVHEDTELVANAHLGLADVVISLPPIKGRGGRTTRTKNNHIVTPPIEGSNNRFAPDARVPLPQLPTMGEGERPSTIEDEAAIVFHSYLQNLAEFADRGIIRGVMVGSSTKEYQGYVWNVFSNNFCLENVRDPTLRHIHECAYQMKKSLRNIIPVLVNAIYDRERTDIEESCSRHKIETSYIPLVDTTTQTSTT